MIYEKTQAIRHAVISAQVDSLPGQSEDAGQSGWGLLCALRGTYVQVVVFCLVVAWWSCSGENVNVVTLWREKHCDVAA